MFPDHRIDAIVSYLPSTALTNPSVPFFGSSKWPNHPGFLYRHVHSNKLLTAREIQVRAGQGNVC